MPDLLTTSEAAERLNCSPKTVRRAIDAGELRVVRLGKSARSDRIHPDDLQAFINEKRKRLECQYTGVVEFGGFRSRSKERELDNRLAAGTKRKPRKSRLG